MYLIPHVTVVVGTTRATVKPENSETVRAALIKASKIHSPAQHAAWRARTGIEREFPKFVEGTSVEQYVIDYHALNLGRFSSVFNRRKEATAACKDFFQPLSTLPMFTPDDTVIEETL